MTESSKVRKTSKERAERRATNRRAHWEAKFAKAETPIDLVHQNMEMLRHQIKTHERKAYRRFGRARAGERDRAAEQLNESMRQIEQVCADAATELARLADQLSRGEVTLRGDA